MTRFLFVGFSPLAGVVSTVVPDSAHKLFIGGLPNYLNDDQVSVETICLTNAKKFSPLLPVILSNRDEVICGNAHLFNFIQP